MSEQRDQVEGILGTVMDPELGIDIVSLGLIYGIAIDNDSVGVLMTLTTPGCPMHGTIRNDVEQKLRQLPWIRTIDVQVTYSPPWTPDRLTPKARVMLGR